jgi:hypothetical protein
VAVSLLKPVNIGRDRIIISSELIKVMVGKGKEGGRTALVP